jgi:hypothetical protein
MRQPWYRLVSRLVGFAACALAAVVAAQWLSLGLGWDPLIDLDTVQRRTDEWRSSLREGPAMLAALASIAGGLVLLAAWVLAGRRSRADGTFRLTRTRGAMRVDRASLAASLERRLDPIDRRVDATVSVSRRGNVDLRLVTPDTSATGTVAEHTRELSALLDQRGLPCKLRSVDVIDVRRLKSRHRVR